MRFHSSNFLGVMVQLSKAYQAEPEIRDDLQGRIEVFDQNIRSFEKRLRAVERRLSLEMPQNLQAGKTHPEIFSDSFQEVTSAKPATDSSVTPLGPSISPEVHFPLQGNSLLSNSVPSITQESISNFAFSSILPSSESSDASMISLDSSSEVSGVSYRIKEISTLFSSLSESLHALQAAISELSDFVHGSLDPEVERLEGEVKNMKSQENASEEYVRKLESRIELLENRDRFTLGSLKVPVEVSGIAGSSVLFLTGFLILSSRWDVIRSPYFSIGLAVIMAGAVLLKFLVVNRKQKSLMH
jgi:chaperonin cofactor prefoldin